MTLAYASVRRHQTKITNEISVLVLQFDLDIGKAPKVLYDSIIVPRQNWKIFQRRFQIGILKSFRPNLKDLKQFRAMMMLFEQSYSVFA